MPVVRLDLTARAPPQFPHTHHRSAWRQHARSYHFLQLQPRMCVMARLSLSRLEGDTIRACSVLASLGGCSLQFTHQPCETFFLWQFCFSRFLLSHKRTALLLTLILRCRWSSG